MGCANIPWEERGRASRRRKQAFPCERKHGFGKFARIGRSTMVRPHVSVGTCVIGIGLLTKLSAAGHFAFYP